MWPLEGLGFESQAPRQFRWRMNMKPCPWGCTGKTELVPGLLGVGFLLAHESPECPAHGFKMSVSKEICLAWWNARPLSPAVKWLMEAVEKAIESECVVDCGIKIPGDGPTCVDEDRGPCHVYEMSMALAAVREEMGT